MTRMEPGLNGPNHLCLWADIHAALGHLAGAPVNDFVPLRLGVRVHGVIKAGNELAGQIRPVLLRQGHYFGHSLGSNAHAAKISASRPVLASAMMGGTFHQKPAKARLFSPQSTHCNAANCFMGAESRRQRIRSWKQVRGHGRILQIANDCQ